MNDDTVVFKRASHILKCSCGEFEINILDYDDETQQKILEHAKSHNATSISLIDEF